MSNSPVVLQMAALEYYAASLRGRGRIVVLTTGVWDMLHTGHIRYLGDASRLGDDLLVGVDSDQLVRLTKGDKRPIQSQDERLEIVSALRVVTHAFIFESFDAVLRVVQPNILVVSPTTVEQNELLGHRFHLAEELDVTVTSISSRSGSHTTDVIGLILNRFGSK